MIAVVAAMRGEIEGDRESFLSGGEIAPVEGVGILGRGEAGILPDGPGLGDVHGRVGAAQIGRDAGIGVEAIEPVEIGRVIDAVDRDAFGREPRGDSAAGCGGSGRNCRRRLRVGELDLCKIRDAAHL